MMMMIMMIIIIIMLMLIMVHHDLDAKAGSAGAYCWLGPWNMERPGYSTVWINIIRHTVPVWFFSFALARYQLPGVEVANHFSWTLAGSQLLDPAIWRFQSQNRARIHHLNCSRAIHFLWYDVKMPASYAYFCWRFSAFPLAWSLPVKVSPAFPWPPGMRPGHVAKLEPVASNGTQDFDVRWHVLIPFVEHITGNKEVRKLFGIIFVLHMSQWPK